MCRMICITSARRRLRRSNEAWRAEARSREALVGFGRCRLGADDDGVWIPPGGGGDAYSGECADARCADLCVEGTGVQHGDGVYAVGGAGVEYSDELSRGNRRG